MANQFIKKIVSGGQNGVDRAALDIAIEFGISHGGWCPYGRKAEDGTIPMKYKLVEAAAPTVEESSDANGIYKKRTELNTIDSDGTLVIAKDELIGGTLYTIEMAKKHKKPYFIFNISNNFETNEIVKWIKGNKIQTLNIAGPRASEIIGIYDESCHVLRKLLNNPLLNQNNQKLSSKKKSSEL